MGKNEEAATHLVHLFFAPSPLQNQAAASSSSAQAGHLPPGWGVRLRLSRKEEHLQRDAGTASCFSSQRELSYCQRGRRFLWVYYHWKNADASMRLTPYTCLSFSEMMCPFSFPPPPSSSSCFKVFPSLSFHILGAATCLDICSSRTAVLLSRCLCAESSITLQPSSLPQGCWREDTHTASGSVSYLVKHYSLPEKEQITRKMLN